jgi:anti-sigma factor RsiW
MIDCPKGEIRDQLPDFLHDQLSTRARAVVSAHVAGCAACAAELSLLRELRGTLRAAPTVDVARVVASLPAPPRGAAAGSRPRLFDWRIAAAVAALAVGGGSAALLTEGLRRGETDRDRIAQPPVPARETAASPEAAQQVATTGLSIDADLAEASTVELQALLEELEAFDGLPSDEPEPPPMTPGVGEEGR